MVLSSVHAGVLMNFISGFCSGRVLFHSGLPPLPAPSCSRQRAGDNRDHRGVLVGERAASTWQAPLDPRPSSMEPVQQGTKCWDAGGVHFVCILPSKSCILLQLTPTSSVLLTEAFPQAWPVGPLGDSFSPAPGTLSTRSLLLPGASLYLYLWRR